MSKIQLTFKTPDAVEYAIHQDSNDFLINVLHIEDPDSPEAATDEVQEALEDRKHKVKELCKRWFEYGELVRIELDTETGMAVVMPVRR